MTQSKGQIEKKNIYCLNFQFRFLRDFASKKNHWLVEFQCRGWKRQQFLLTKALKIWKIWPIFENHPKIYFLIF
jgi:hypothetical protein